MLRNKRCNLRRNYREGRFKHLSAFSLGRQPLGGPGEIEHLVNVSVVQHEKCGRHGKGVLGCHYLVVVAYVQGKLVANGECCDRAIDAVEINQPELGPKRSRSGWAGAVQDLWPRK